jgi:hypothetical protein
LSDPTTAAAVQLARSIADGNDESAQRLAATAEVMAKELLDHKLDTLQSKALSDRTFNSQVCEPLRNALRDVGTTLDDAQLNAMDAQQLAAVLAEMVAANPELATKTKDAVTLEAIRQAAHIAAGDSAAAQMLVAVESVEAVHDKERPRKTKTAKQRWAQLANLRRATAAMNSGKKKPKHPIWWEARNYKGEVWYENQGPEDTNLPDYMEVLPKELKEYRDLPWVKRHGDWYLYEGPPPLNPVDSDDEGVAPFVAPANDPVVCHK